MPSPRLLLLLLGLFACGWGGSPLSAQQRPTDFGRWAFGVGADRVGRPAELEAVWRFPVARVFWVGTPLGAGDVEAGFRMAEAHPLPSALAAGVPQVEILEAFLGWRWRRALIGPVVAGAGGQLGVERYSFDDGPNESETELTGAAIVSLGVAPGPWRAEVEGGLRRVYSRPRAWNPTLGVRASGSFGLPTFVTRALGPGDVTPECDAGDTHSGPTMSDRLRRASGGGGASADGFHWDFSFRGLAASGTTTPVVVLDGVRTDMDLFGSVPWNALPLHSAATPCVRLVEEVANGLAGLNGRGEVHIETPRPPRGFSLDLAATAANEVGDQGLWRYASSSRHNVDRPLQGMEASASVASSTASLQVGIADRFWVMGDPALRARVRSGYDADSFFAIGAVPWYVRARWEPGERGVRAWWGATPVDDFRFIPTLGREVPLSVEARGGGAAVDLGRIAGGTVKWRAAASRVSLDPRPNTLDIDPAARLDRWSSEATWRMEEADGATWRMGAGVSGREAEIGFVNPAESMEWRASGGGTSPDGRLSGDLEISYIDERPRLAVRLGWTAPVGERGRVGVTGSSTVAGPGADETFARWSDAGIRGAEGLTPDGPFGWTEAVARQTGLDMFVQSGGGARSGRVGAFVRRHSRLQLAVASHRYDPASSTFPAQARLERDLALWVAGLWLDGRVRWAPRWTASGRLDIQDSPGGHTPVTDAMARLPRLRASARAEWSGGSGVDLALSAWLRSGVTWTSFAGLEQASGGRWSEVIPTSLRFDVSAVKHMRAANARLEIGLRNLTNTEVRWHPIGLREDLTLFARVRVVPSLRLGR